MTLIEVVAGIALLGTLLVAVLMTQADCRRQTAAARLRLAGCEVAEELLRQWWAAPESFPRDGHGTVIVELGEFTWRTRARRDEEAEKLGGRVVRLEVAHSSLQLAERSKVIVDVVLPTQQEPGVLPD